ncbi:MAG: DUF108 domain-containing protein [Actinomycetota bacterium]|nr:DUF108 domain-containing protein [Actinomycetota bacterium]
MPSIDRPSLGVIGYGFIGRHVAEQAAAPGSGMQLAWVHNRTPDRLDELPPTAVLADLRDIAKHPADLVVEAAHPEVTVNHGARILERSHYMPFSTTALVDDEVRGRLIHSAERHGSQLFLPAGALIGGDALTIGRQNWREVRITFLKHPRNIDFTDSGFDSSSLDGPTTVFEGPVREIAPLYPRNVNTMVTAALLATGLDHCIGTLVADPSLDVAVAIVQAWGTDGSYMRTEKRQPAIGVSGIEMAASAWLSVCRALSAGEGIVVHA